MAPSKLASLHRNLLAQRVLVANPLAALVLASSLLGCATQAQTGQLLSAAGTAAVIAGAVMSDDDGCYGDFGRGNERGLPCGDGRMSGSEKAGIALAVAGLATAAVGNALQEDAARLDARRRVSQGPTTYTPTPLPPPAYAPAGTFHPFLPSSPFILTPSCTCQEPAPVAPPACAAPDEGQRCEGASSPAPAAGAAASEGDASEGAANEAATSEQPGGAGETRVPPAGCTCPAHPAAPAPSEAPAESSPEAPVEGTPAPNRSTL